MSGSSNPVCRIEDEENLVASLESGQLSVMPCVQGPAGTEELLAYLNAIPGLAAEGVYRMNNYSVVEWEGRPFVYDGDQSIFDAGTHDAAYSFIAGLAVMANEFLQRAIDPSQLLREDPP